MPEAFQDAAERHWQDTNILVSQRRFANADQLVGFAAECAIKSALSAIQALAPAGVLNKYYKCHIDELWDKVPLQNVQKRFPSLVAILSQRPSPFCDWSTDNRYCADNLVSEQSFEIHHRAARRVLGSVGFNGSRKGEI